jgi:hypothetical protein
MRDLALHSPIHSEGRAQSAIYFVYHQLVQQGIFSLQLRVRGEVAVFIMQTSGGNLFGVVLQF